ncbi:MAG: hypothetical protein ACFFD4_32955 [Candidatus Odinarchaeota archaeon]
MPVTLLILVTAASLAMLFGIIIVIWKKSEQASNQVTWILILADISVATWFATSYIQIDFVTIESDLLGYAIVATVGNIALILILIFLANFFRLLVQPYPSALQNSYLLSLGALLTGIAITSIYGGVQGDVTLVEFCWTLADMLNLIIMPSAALFIYTDLRDMLAEPLSDKQRRQVISIRNGLFFGVVAVLPFILLQRLVDRIFFSFTLPIVAFSIFFFTRAYLLDPRVAFILPHRTYLVVVVTHTGSLKYSRNFMEKSAGDPSAMLVSMGLSAIKTMLSEFYQADVHPTYLSFVKQKIMFHWNEGYFIAVFTDRNSMLIRQAMEQTAKEIRERFKEDLQDVMEGPKELDLDDIITKTFNFIY